MQLLQYYEKRSDKLKISSLRVVSTSLAPRPSCRQATAASQPLIAELFKHGAPVPMIRMDWMVKRRGPGQAQVVFGEYCEMGACCLKWQEGPPKIWRSALDVVLY